MPKRNRMPLAVWILTLAAFAVGTAEFVIAGLLTQVADSLMITEGQAGHLITVYALAIVFGGPCLTLLLAPLDKKLVLVGLMAVFVLGNLLSFVTSDYNILLISRVVVGLTQGPFYGIGAVLATRMVPASMEGRALGQMFAGLTLANVLGVPGGTWVGDAFGWNTTFLAVAAFGLVAGIAVVFAIPRQIREAPENVLGQLSAFRNPDLLASLLITVLAWTGFMAFYGYIAPVAEQSAGIPRENLSWLLVLVGAGLVIGNWFGGRSADTDLNKALMIWPVAMIASLLVVGMLSANPWGFALASFVFGIASFANVPPMQMRVMVYGQAAPELAATANISAFNVANALGGIIGASVIDSSLGASAIPFAAALVPVAGVLFILTQRRRAMPEVVGGPLKGL